MNRNTLLAALPVAGLSLALAVPSTAAATEAPAPSFSQVIGTVQLDPANPEVATVQARYRCTGEAHLWVSVKQTADRTADPRLTQEGSSRRDVSVAWSDRHRNEIDCDGKIHVGRFSIDQMEPVWGTNAPKSTVYEPLAKGVGYVQFCLYDELTGEGGATSNEFRNVH